MNAITCNEKNLSRQCGQRTSHSVLHTRDCLAAMFSQLAHFEYIKM
jgi:hypothetical protein